MKKTISLKIHNGKINADFNGFQGKDCERLHDRIKPEELDIQNTELKPEYHFEASGSQTETELNKW